MMAISRFSLIRKHRIFRDFSWPADLEDFGRYNLIFGMNGSGKTTLSSLFRHLEKRENISEGEVRYVIDNREVHASTLANNATLPVVRVFNRDFVSANVFRSEGAIDPIFYLGQDSIEQQQQIDKLKSLAAKKAESIKDKQSMLSSSQNELETLLIAQAKSVKDLLSSNGQNPYNNYNKAKFRNQCEKFLLSNYASVALSDDEKNKIKLQKDASPKDPIAVIKKNFPDLAKESEIIGNFLERTITSQILDELRNDHTFSHWVREGIQHHSGENTTDACRFCGQTIPEDRLEKLNGHFSDHYNASIKWIDDKLAHYEAIRQSIVYDPPPRAAFYDHVWDGFSSIADQIAALAAEHISYIEKLTAALIEKKSRPFEVLDLTDFVGTMIPPNSSAGTVLVKLANEAINLHNSQSTDFQKTVEAARNKLEASLIAESMEEFKRRTESIAQLESDIRTLANELSEIGNDIKQRETLILEHLRPADELNAELQSYLGRDELRFEVKDTGYHIRRGDERADNLSEGEKTAIAFLYFLKCLQGKDFDLENGIVVIDDPVSSLDTNALFCAFAFMKERTKTAGQLFILTHNAALFRQVKNWFNHVDGQRKKDVKLRPARFMMTSPFYSNEQGIRSSRICRLDPLLHEHDSDYHYMFRLVYQTSLLKDQNNALVRYYGMPNVARRLLESFLAFRYPEKTGELRQQLDEVSFDSAKKARILRFLHTYSHDGKIGEAEQDLSILSETPQVLANLLELLKCEDANHFARMESLSKVEERELEPA